MPHPLKETLNMDSKPLPIKRTSTCQAKESLEIPQPNNCKLHYFLIPKTIFITHILNNLNYIYLCSKLHKYYMQSNPTVKKATRRELTNECNALEITNGKVTSLMGLSNNEISSNYHLSSNIVLGLLFKLIKPCPLLLMISIIIIIVLPKSEAYPLWIYVTEFALILLILVLKEIYFDIIRRRADEKVNKRELLKDSKVFRDGKELNNLCWGDIK